MKIDPADFDLWPMFDSYVKKSIKLANKEYNKICAKYQLEACTEDSILLSFLEKGVVDIYPSDNCCLVVDERVYWLRDEKLYQALMRLPKKLRKIIVLRYFEEYSEKTIAKITKVSTRCTLSRRKKALKLLRKIMEEGVANEKNESPVK